VSQNPRFSRPKYFHPEIFGDITRQRELHSV
jgi:hypothetical protein